MDWRRLGLACLCLLAALPNGQCGRVLSVVLPGPQSHLFGMKKVSEAVAARGHAVQVWARIHRCPPTKMSYDFRDRCLFISVVVVCFMVIIQMNMFHLTVL